MSSKELENGLKETLKSFKHVLNWLPVMNLGMLSVTPSAMYPKDTDVSSSQSNAHILSASRVRARI